MRFDSNSYDFYYSSGRAHLLRRKKRFTTDNEAEDSEQLAVYLKRSRLYRHTEIKININKRTD